MVIWSYTLLEAKQEKVAANGMLPSFARPDATPIMLDSETPQFTKLSGHSSITHGFVPDALLRSASRQYILLSWLINSLMVWPYTARISISCQFIVISPFSKVIL